jgi:hypothetical protein
MFAASLIGLIYFCYDGYYSWFKPQEYLIRIANVKKKTHKIFPFLPKRIIGFLSFDLSPKGVIWNGRIGCLLFILFFLLGMIAAIWSPDTK